MSAPSEPHVWSWVREYDVLLDTMDAADEDYGDRDDEPDLSEDDYNDEADREAGMDWRD